jgi:hypothetical protein
LTERLAVLDYEVCFDDLDGDFQVVLGGTI